MNAFGSGGRGKTIPEPPKLSSAFDHVRQRCAAPSGGVPDHSLPDDEFRNRRWGGGIGFAPGATDGVLRHGPIDPKEGARKARVLHRAVLRLMRDSETMFDEGLTSLFVASYATTTLRPLLALLAKKPPKDQDTFYTRVRRLLLETGHREVVKFAMGITASFRRREDLEVFRTFAWHPEFATYAGEAILAVSSDPVSDLMLLAKDAEGWGKIGLVERLLETPRPDVCTHLLRDGLENVENLEGEVALRIATVCRLHEALASPELDTGLVQGISRILETLTREAVEGGPDGTMLDYPEGVVAVERFVMKFENLASTTEDFLMLAAIRAFVQSERIPAEKFRVAGWDAAARKRVALACSRVMDRPEWVERARKALGSDDASERWRGMEVARCLGMPLHDYIVARVRADPLEDGMWFKLVWGTDEAGMDDALALAAEVLDVEAIATGPALESWVGPEHRRHNCVGYLLQELRRFPGKGWKVIRAALRSPVTNNRSLALRILGLWKPEQISPEIAAAIQATLRDPDEEVGNTARELLEKVRRTLS